VRFPQGLAFKPFSDFSLPLRPTSRTTSFRSFNEMHPLGLLAFKGSPSSHPPFFPQRVPDPPLFRDLNLYLVGFRGFVRAEVMSPLGGRKLLSCFSSDGCLRGGSGRRLVCRWSRFPFGSFSALPLLDQSHVEALTSLSRGNGAQRRPPP